MSFGTVGKGRWLVVHQELTGHSRLCVVDLHDVCVLIASPFPIPYRLFIEAQRLRTPLGRPERRVPQQTRTGECCASPNS